MGSARVSNAKPIPMEKEKKTLKKKIQSILFGKKDKPKEKDKAKCQEKNKIEERPIEQKKDDKKKQNTVATILENFQKLDLEDQKRVEEEKEEDELENFAKKVIEEPRNERIHSHSSEDSGFSDTKDADKTESDNKSDDKSDDIVEELEKLDLEDDDKKKKKKVQTVVISRAPMRLKQNDYAAAVHPYAAQDPEKYRQISQINKNTFTGGQVTVNHTVDNYSEIDIALQNVQQKSQYLQNDPDSYLEDVLQYIHEDTKKTDHIEPKIPNYQLDYGTKIANNDITIPDFQYIQSLPDSYIENSLIDEYVQNNPIQKEELTQIYDIVEKKLVDMCSDPFMTEYSYPTPPRSENVPSPMSASPGSFYPTSEYTLSPERSPMYHCDYEKYQEIPNFEADSPVSLDKKVRERTASVSSMTMKQFKDVQKELEQSFSKKECCQRSRKSCKEIFQEHWQKLEKDERKNVCFKVANMDLKSAYGVLHHILLSLSRGSDCEDLKYALFQQLCDRLLAQDTGIFISDAGLSLLKAATLRCPERPLLTRYLVQCIRIALKTDSNIATGKDYVFNEVDALGDNLVTACARAGDRCADVLYELTVAHDNQPPLFKPNHTNSDGYTALHVACSQHSSAHPRLHIVHTLIQHANYKITDGDLKGRDTALHLAVNSANCDLQLILLMFKHVDRKEWKSLAHCPNLSTKTPIDLARLATKSSTRQNYPTEVLEFLKKCR